jgi:hypothetical protein
MLKKKIIAGAILLCLVSVMVAPGVAAANHSDVQITVRIKQVGISLNRTAWALGWQQLNAILWVSNQSETTGTWKSNSWGLITNTGNYNETIHAIGENAATWTIATTPGADAFALRIRTNATGLYGAGAWGNLSTNCTISNNVHASGTMTFGLQYCTPTSTTTYAQQSTNISFSAVLNA